MKSQVESKNKTQHTVKVEIPAEVVSRKLADLFRRAAREIALPGFRPGHAPRRVLEARFGKDFLNDDAKQELIQEYLPQALNEHQLKPVSTPAPKDVGQFADGQPFTFEVDVEVLPEIEVKDYVGLEIEEPSPRQPTHEEIETVLDRLRTEHATAVPKAANEKIAAEDLVTVHTENAKEPQEVRVSSEGVTATLIGHTVGDWAELTFEDGKKLKVKVEIIKKLEKPDDEELANILGHESVQEMEQKIRAQLAERLEKQRQRDLRFALLDKIVAQTAMEIPPRMLDEIVGQELEILRRSGYPEATAEQVRKLKESAEKRLKRELVMNTIKKQENLKLSDADFEALLKAEAEKRNMNPIKLRAVLEREGQLQGYRAEHEDERVFQFLLEKAQLTKTEK